MPRTHAYGLPDLFALVSRLLAPFVDPLRAEFATRVAEKSTEVTPTAEPSATTVDVRPAAESTGIPAQAVAPCVVEMTSHQPDGLNVGKTIESMLERSPTTPDIGIPISGVVGDAGIPASYPVAGIPPSLPDSAPAGVELQQGHLFVRKKSGGQWRYHVAPSDSLGPKFRRQNHGRRVRYEPVH